MNHKTENTRRILTLLALFGVSAVAWAAGADLGQAQKQPTNWTATGMFATSSRPGQSPCMCSC